MYHPRMTVAGAIAVVSTAALLSAAPAAAALDTASLSCRASVAKNFNKLLKSANKVIGGCHKSRNKGKVLPGVDCNDMAQADADKGKYDKVAGKFTDKVNADCAGQTSLTAADVGGASDETEFYVSCPVDPCTGVAGLIDTVDEISACLVCQAAAIAEGVGVATLGAPVPANLDKDEQKCHAAIAKGYAKYLRTAHKEEVRCQGDSDDTGDYALTGCLDADPKGKTAKALSKADEGLDKKCPGTVNLTDIDSCADTSLGDIKACNGTDWNGAGDVAFTSTFELPALGCPTTVRTTVLGGCSTQGSVAGGCSGGFESSTVLSVGWKGLAHGADISDSYTTAVDVTCAGTEKGSCGICTSTGLSVDNPQYQSFTRCVDDPAIECDVPFGPDVKCPLNGQCVYFLGPPLAISSGGSPTCSLSVLNSDIVGGTGDPDLGTGDFVLDLRSIVYLGISQSRPCPICRFDPNPQDGNRSGGECAGGANAGLPCSVAGDCPGGTCLGNFGTCFDGPHDGDPCDVQGFDLTFARTQICVGGTEAGTNCLQDSDCGGAGTCEVDSTNPTSGNSLDCPPTSGANISGAGLAIALPLTTGVSSKDAVDPCESPNEGLDCFCGVCDHDPTISCNDDLECDALSIGSVCGIGIGVARKPNNCSDGVCTAVTSDRGECSTHPDVDSFCSGVLFASGKGILSCGNNADCTSYNSVGPAALDPDNWVCPGNDCGTCTVDSFRSCFNDPMSLTGSPDPGSPVLVGSFCLPPSSSGSVNNATGSPGPGSLQTDSRTVLRY